MDRLMVVTTEQSSDSIVLKHAAGWARELSCRFEPDKMRIRELQEQHKDGSNLLIIVVGRERTRLLLGGRAYYFHPNMAKLRLQNLVRGEMDQFVQATGLEKGSSLLDCTLGLGADAIVASHVAGPEGRVVGLECTPVLGMLVKEGFSKYNGLKGNRQNPVLQQALVEAMRRITVNISDSFEYLSKLQDCSFDIIYFDPMFRHTREQSSAMDLLRMLGSNQPLTTSLLDQARRVAAKRVVVKERRGSSVFKELGIGCVAGGKYSSVAYGIIEK
ncbi:MAG TPA: class I SAM-dependent methyltransferase [Bacillota bacterium]|nr:class I SAM-dependent methyltransferase [Bacillota bacterium]